MESGFQGLGGQISEKVRNSPALSLLFLLWFCLLGMLLGNLIVLALSEVLGFGTELLQGMVPEAVDRKSRDFLRLATLFAHFCSFTLPALAFTFWLRPASWKEDLALQKRPSWNILFAAILFITLSFPFSQFLYWWNLQLPLPEQLLEMERSANEMVKVFIHMDDAGELLLNLLTVGLIAALGEELVFRGIIQPRLSGIFRNDIAGLWVGAILFSAIHFQFAGFLPRLALGAALGYLFYWTRNLWVAIAAHFFFNGAQIIVQYFFKTQMDQLDPEQMQRPHWMIGVLPLAGMLLLAQYFNKRRTNHYGI